MLKPKFASSKKALFHFDKMLPQIKLKYFSLFLVCCFFNAEITVAQNLNNLENRILVNMSEHRTKGMTNFIQFSSNSIGYVSLGVPSFIILKGIITKDKAERENGLYIVKSLAFSSVHTYLLKYSINRQRPFEANPKIIKAGKGGSPSFPSGHASEAFATATSISLIYPEWYVIAPAFAWAGIVGFSRMYLGVHYLSDVLAGAILGSGSAWLMYQLKKWIEQDKKKRTVADYGKYILK